MHKRVCQLEDALIHLCVQRLSTESEPDVYRESFWGRLYHGCHYQPSFGIRNTTPFNKFRSLVIPQGRFFEQIDMPSPRVLNIPWTCHLLVHLTRFMVKSSPEALHEVYELLEHCVSQDQKMPKATKSDSLLVIALTLGIPCTDQRLWLRDKRCVPKPAHPL